MTVFLWFNRDGEPITVAEADRLLGDRSYVVLAIDQVGDCDVSTVWLGFDHSFGEGDRPLLFESLVLSDGPLGGFRRRFSTEQEALAGHQAMIEVCRLEQQLRS